jgi:hypothetical protein
MNPIILARMFQDLNEAVADLDSPTRALILVASMTIVTTKAAHMIIEGTMSEEEADHFIVKAFSNLVTGYWGSGENLMLELAYQMKDRPEVERAMERGAVLARHWIIQFRNKRDGKKNDS